MRIFEIYFDIINRQGEQSSFSRNEFVFEHFPYKYLSIKINLRCKNASTVGISSANDTVKKIELKDLKHSIWTNLLNSHLEW